MFTKDYVKNIFYTGSFAFNYDEQLVVDILFLLNEGLLMVESKKIGSIKQYQNYLEKIEEKKISVFDIAGGSNGHMALKLIANDYLKLIGNKKVNYEQEFEGYFPDVINDSKTVIVECGNTNPDKIFNYFKNKKIKKFFILPYPTHNKNDLIIYIFRPSLELSEFLIFREKELLHQVINKQKNA